MKAHIVVINGVPRSGKDEFVEMCKLYANVECVSMVDFVKNIAKEMGWNGEKTPENRKFLSDLKDLIDDWGDVSYRFVKERINSWINFYEKLEPNDALPSKSTAIIFVMAREIDDIRGLVAEFDATTILLRRNEVEDTIQSNHADAEVFEYKDYDFEINNNGSLRELQERAAYFVTYISFQNEMERIKEIITA